MSQDRALRFETFVNWYLRFNGYFTVPNFVVHAGNDLDRISGDVVGNLTEIDTLALRLPYSREKSGTNFPTHRMLADGAEGRLDVVFAEVKSGKDNSPNTTWQQRDRVSDIEYTLRFVGWHRDDAKIQKVAEELQANYTFTEADIRLRYVIFSREEDRTWKKRGVKYITFDDCINFISEERGQCWAQSGIGRRSMHIQWDPLIKAIFEVANNGALDHLRRKDRIWAILDRECQVSGVLGSHTQRKPKNSDRASG